MKKKNIRTDANRAKKNDCYSFHERFRRKLNWYGHSLRDPQKLIVLVSKDLKVTLPEFKITDTEK